MRSWIYPIVISLFAGAYARASDLNETVVVIDVTQDRNPAWLRHDRALLERLRNELRKISDQEIWTQAKIDEWFAEPRSKKTPQRINKAKQLIESGKIHSTQLKADRAIANFQRALLNLRSVFADLTDFSLFEEAHFQLGMTYQARGKTDLANNEYRMVLLINPDRKLDEGIVSPTVIKRFEQVRQELLSSLKGSMSLLSQPVGARVFMDGKHVGYTPVTIPGLVPGKHYFSAHLAGYKTWFGVLDVPQGGLGKQKIFFTEGKRIARLHLLRRMAQFTTKTARLAAKELAEQMKVTDIVMIKLTHPADQTMLRLSAYKAGQSIDSLGVFPYNNDAQLSMLAGKVNNWLRGERPPEIQLVDKQPQPSPIPAVENLTPQQLPEPIPEQNQWYQTWWFWSAVGLVVASATTTTILLLPRDRGLQIQVYR